MDSAVRGEMQAFRTSVPHSAVYVAMERVEGKIDGGSGSFVFIHLGDLTRGAPELKVRVVPDSGTGDLPGPSGGSALKSVTISTSTS